MNSKRWIAVGLGILIFLVSILIPAFRTKEEEALTETYSKMFGFGNIFGKDGRTEEIMEDGDPSNRIAVVSLEGTIQNGAPYGPGYTHENLVEQLRDLSEDESIKGVMLVLNTPGGTIFGSEEIRQEIINIKNAGIPIYSSMKNMAASGGYYIASETDRIFAYPDTVTGSIGVVLQSIDTTGLQEKLGIKVKEYTAGALKRVNAEDDEKIKEEEDKVYQDFVDEGYERFVKIVSEGRNMDLAKVKELADGRIYTAYQALDLHLIDEIASTEAALDSLITDTGLDNPQVFSYTYPELGTLPSFFNMFSKTDLDLIKEIYKQGPNLAPQAYYIYGGE